MMDKIKSLDDLRKLKQQAADGLVHIKVAMATCSIASGARETMDAFLEKIGKENLNAAVTQTGCMGYCHAEPTVEVHKPGEAPVVFGHVDALKAENPRLLAASISTGSTVSMAALRFEATPAPVIMVNAATATSTFEMLVLPKMM